MRLDPFYLIVSDAERIEALVPRGVRLVQLRLKDATDAVIRDQVNRSLAVSNRHGAQLVVNDHWQIALECGADFVHLGQEDLDTADIAALRRADVRLGLSTHDRAELDRALSLEPDYIALGPIYETTLKKMKWRPQGLEKLSRWKQAVGDVPLVAIGGLTIERLADVFAAGADSAAVVTDIQTSRDPVAQTEAWIAATRPA